jgi:hypothetical protein
MFIVVKQTRAEFTATKWRGDIFVDYFCFPRDLLLVRYLDNVIS